MQPATPGMMPMQPAAPGMMPMQPMTPGMMPMQPAAPGMMPMQPATPGMMPMQPAASGATGAVTEGFYGGMINTAFITLAVLFFVLSPGVLFRLPPRGSCYVAALVHAVIFVFVLRIVSPYTAYLAEGFKAMKYANTM